MITIIIAIYGALVATGAILWNIYVYQRDKGKLNVQCYYAAVDRKEFDFEVKFCFNITNIGKRPITVSGVGITVDYNGTDLTITSKTNTFPKLLYPGENILEYTDHHTNLDLSAKSIWAEDSIGKKYELKKKGMDKLLKNKPQYASLTDKRQK